MNADELYGIEMDLMPIGGKERTLPECVGAQRRSAAGVWNGQVDAAACLGATAMNGDGGVRSCCGTDAGNARKKKKKRR